jgi:hypothetical protein
MVERPRDGFSVFFFTFPAERLKKLQQIRVFPAAEAVLPADDSITPAPANK